MFPGNKAINHRFSFITNIRCRQNFNKNNQFLIKGSNINQMSTPFILLISNSNQLGYHVTLTPNASLIDGKLNLVLIDKMNWFKIFSFLLMSLFRYYPNFFQIKKSEIHKLELRCREREFIYQIDGELVNKKTKKLNISILNRKVKVIVK